MRRYDNSHPTLKLVRFFIDYDFRSSFNDLGKCVKWRYFFVNPSPLSKDMRLILPVDFFIIVLLTTELGMYSMISTMIYELPFINSAESTKTLSSLPKLLISFILSTMRFNISKMEDVLLFMLYNYN
jgi:hypothetical protein